MEKELINLLPSNNNEDCNEVGGHEPKGQKLNYSLFFPKTKKLV